MLVSSLPMYDLPEYREATDAWWSGIAELMVAEGIEDVPMQLQRSYDPLSQWLSPDLLLSQTCGYPFTYTLSGKVQYVATLRYDTPYQQGTDYCSLLIVPEDSAATNLSDLRGARLVINGFDSHSGYNVLKHSLEESGGIHDFFSDVAIADEHRKSLHWVSTNKADICAVDCITHELIKQCAPEELSNTRIIGRCASYPGLPLITSNTVTKATVRRIQTAVKKACATKKLGEVRKQLLISGVEVLKVDRYSPEIF